MTCLLKSDDDDGLGKTEKIKSNFGPNKASPRWEGWRKLGFLPAEFWKPEELIVSAVAQLFTTVTRSQTRTHIFGIYGTTNPEQNYELRRFLAKESQYYF